MKELLTPLPDAWKALGIGRSTLYELIKSGRLNCVRIGRRKLIPTNELERYVAGLQGQNHTSEGGSAA